MQLAYIAGPYRGQTINDYYENIQKARAVGVEYAKKGYYPVIPHTNSAFMDGVQSDEFWLEGTLSLLDRCDVVVMVPGWEKSQGATKEYERAKELGKQVIS